MTIPIIPEKLSCVHRLRLALALVAAAALLLTACTCSSKQPPGTSGATSEATPTPVPADLTLAANLERNGQYEEAEAAYAAVVREGSDADKQAARIGVARVALQRNDSQLAYDAVVAYKDAGGTSPSADFLLARALAAENSPDDAGAVEAYQQYVDEGGVASANAHSETAYALLSLGRIDEAEQDAEAALKGLPESLRPGIIVSVAQGLEGANANSEAINWYQRLYDESDASADKALLSSGWAS